MIISSRRRLYSNIITEDNGDIGVNSTVELWGYEYYWFDDIVKAFLSDNSIEISLDDQNYNNAEYDTYNYARENNTIDVTIATLSDKIAKRFNYDVSKLNTFISGYLDNGFDGDMYGIGTVKLVDVFFYKSSPYSDTIFLKGTFNFNPDFFRTLYFDVPRISGNRSYRRAGIDFNVSVDDYILKYGDDYIPCIYASGGDITINFSNLNIHEDDFIIMTYAETKFAYE